MLIKNSLKYLLIIVIFLFSTFLITKYNYETYAKKTNTLILLIANDIESQYSDYDETKLLDILNNKKIDTNVLFSYGFDIEDIDMIESMNTAYETNLKTNLIFIFIILLFVTTICFYMDYKKYKTIDELTLYLNQLNNKNYDIDIMSNEDSNLSKLKNEIYKTTILLKEQANMLQEEKRLLKDNIVDISHQLKTPLASISIMVDNIIENKDMNEFTRSDFLNDINNSLEHINFLVMNLLKLSRFDANVIEFKNEKINVLKFINEIKQDLNYLVKDKKIDFDIDINSKIYFYGDYKWQKEAISNILKNAIEHTRDKIIINATKNNFFVNINISDNGSGISKKDLKNMFERFYKSKDSKGVGVGLNLAQTIIKKDKGLISVKRDSLTTFEIKYFNKEHL